MSITTATDLLAQVLKTTGSNDAINAKWCINIGEQKLRNLNLPLLTSDPYDLSSVGIADGNGFIKIPTDMREPIQFFRNGTQFTAAILCTGTAGTNTVNLSVAPPQPLVVGMSVIGTGIAVGTKVSGYNNQIATLSSNNLTNINSVLTFRSDPTVMNRVGPWTVYNRVSAREGIREAFGSLLAIYPVGVSINTGTFSEVNNKYIFNPPLTQGSLINLYYYKSFDKLFSPIGSTLLSANATITSAILSGLYWTATVSVPMTGLLTNLQVGDTVYATAVGGSFNSKEVEVINIYSDGISFKVRKYNDGTPITNGSITGLYVNDVVKSNIILSNYPEGYFYAALAAYYSFNNQIENQLKYEKAFAESMGIIEEQNAKGSFLGGENTFTSAYLPRSRLKRRGNQYNGYR